jgi:hypothetical protein
MLLPPLTRRTSGKRDGSELAVSWARVRLLGVPPVVAEDGDAVVVVAAADAAAKAGWVISAARKEEDMEEDDVRGGATVVCPVVPSCPPEGDEADLSESANVALSTL